MAERVYSTQKELNDFGKWVVANGGYIHPSLVFTPGDSLSSSGATIHTTAPLAPSTPLLKCPHSLTLDYSKARAHFSGTFTRAVNSRTTNYMFLCHQTLLGEKSFWAPYINILPREFDTPLYFTPEDMEWLRGCNLGAAEAETRRESWRKEWALAVEVLESEGVQTGAYTWELFLWAATVFTSRSFPGKLLKWTEKEDQWEGVNIPTDDEGEGDAPALFPLIDSTNHYPRTKITWQPGETELTIVSGEVIEDGGEVVNNYGPKANEELLMGYGFTIPSNPFDTVVLKFNPPFSPAQQSIRDRQTSTYPHDTSPPGIHHLLLTLEEKTHSLYPRSLVDIFHISTASPSDIPRLQANPTAASVSTRNTLSTHTQLFLAMKRKLDGIVVANETLEREPQNARQRASKVYRDTQVSILSAAIEESRGVLRDSLANPIVVRFSHALQESPFSDAVKMCFGTKEEEKIRAMGLEDMIFVLYICWKYISLASAKSPEWKSWFGTMMAVYGSPKDGGENVDDVVRQNYADIFPAAGEIAEGVFGGDDWTVELMAWVMRVYQMEGVDVRTGEEVAWVICLEG